MSADRKSIKQFETFKAAGFPTTRHVTKSNQLCQDILKSINQKDGKGHRGIKVITRGATTSEYEKAVTSVLKQKDWQVAYLSDIEGDPRQALGLILNKDVFIDTLDPKKLLQQGYNVIRVNPPVVVPEDNNDDNIVTSPSVKPLLVFIAVLALVIIAAWAAWRISR